MGSLPTLLARRRTAAKRKFLSRLYEPENWRLPDSIDDCLRSPREKFIQLGIISARFTTRGLGSNNIFYYTYEFLFIGARNLNFTELLFLESFFKDK